jgi:hypothetical protein
MWEGIARGRGGSVNMVVTDGSLSRAGSLPQLDWG